VEEGRITKKILTKPKQKRKHWTPTIKMERSACFSGGHGPSINILCDDDEEEKKEDDIFSVIFMYHTNKILRKYLFYHPSYILWLKTSQICHHY
jgi:hypothetical protein